jgi:hypothetical protein
MSIMDKFFMIYMEHIHDILHKKDWVDVSIKPTFHCEIHTQVCKHCQAERTIYLNR